MLLAEPGVHRCAWMIQPLSPTSRHRVNVLVMSAIWLAETEGVAH